MTRILGTSVRNGIKVRVVDHDLIMAVLNNHGTGDEILGRFLCKEWGDTWTAIDNSTGNAFVEIFKTRDWAMKWLTTQMDADTAHERDLRLYESRKAKGVVQ